MKAFFRKYIKSYLPIILFLFIVFVVFVVIIILLNIFFINTGKQIESLTDMSVSFCNKFGNDTSQLEVACGHLTSSNCKNSNCCVFVNGNKCSAGGTTGPTYKTDKDGNKIEVESYYYLNKCHGNNCPIVQSK